MGFKLSQRSLDKMTGVNPKLVEVVKLAITKSPLDFSISEGLRTVERQKELENKKEVLFARISAYESMFDFDTAYRYAKAYVKAYPKDANGKKELTFLETR